MADLISQALHSSGSVVKNFALSLVSDQDDVNENMQIGAAEKEHQTEMLLAIPCVTPSQMSLSPVNRLGFYSKD